MALLVGMSPHEIRRLEKKKGLNLRRYKESSIDVLGKTSPMQAYEYDHNLNDGVNSTESSEDGDVNEIGGGQKNTSMNNEDGGTLPISHEDTSFVDENDPNDSIEALNMKSSPNFNHEHGSENLSDNTGGSHESPSSRQAISSKSAKKLSLLGHGPHGKQVVERLLNDYGEDGIHQFCQRWRHVFVEAVHPHFLPSGWDIMHR